MIRDLPIGRSLRFLLGLGRLKQWLGGPRAGGGRLTLCFSSDRLLPHRPAHLSFDIISSISPHLDMLLLDS
jgi:hypothetical protein